MKKLIILSVLSCLLITGCGSIRGENTTPTTVPSSPTVPSTSAPAITVPTTQPTTAPATEPTVPPTTAPQSVTFQVYYPDESFVEFLNKEVTLDVLTADAVMQELINAGLIHADVTVNSVTLDGTQLSLDLSGTFLNQLYTLGSTGEHFVIGGIVNTFLSAYGAETVLITADGAFMDSGHVVYDFPLSFVE